MPVLSRILIIGLCALVASPVCAKRRRRKKQRSGTVIVQSKTAGAQIYVDEDFVGEVPMKFPLALKKGQHTIKVTLPGYADFLDTFKIKRRKDLVLEVDLLPIAGLLQVSSDPTGAVVIIDGQLMGETPFNGEIEPGKRQIEVRSTGFTGNKRILKIEAGARYTIVVSLVPIPVFIEEETPWFGHWWVWAGAAAAVGGVVAISVISSQSDIPPEPPFKVNIEPVR